MNFRIHALDYEQFLPFFEQSDHELAKHNARKVIAEDNLGYPCRVSLEDASIGKELLLLNYTHLDVSSPYHSKHAIYVSKNAEKACLSVNEVPDMLSRRLLSVRGFDETHMMIAAEVLEGVDLKSHLNDIFDRSEVSYVHIHNAKPGCFAARATRA